jgi:hypothetical protein
MEMDTAKSNGVASWHGQICLSAEGQQCAEKQNRRAHPRDQLLIDPTGMDAIRANREGQGELVR